MSNVKMRLELHAVFQLTPIEQRQLLSAVSTERAVQSISNGNGNVFYFLVAGYILAGAYYVISTLGGDTRQSIISSGTIFMFTTETVFSSKAFQS